MTTINEASKLVAELEESLCTDPDVRFAVVFGSLVTGEATAGSDVDLAVKFAETLSATDRFRKRCVLSGRLQRDDRPFIDVSDVETLPLAVAHDAVGGRLVCGDQTDFEAFKREIDTRFDERRQRLRRQQRAVIDRIAEEGLRG